jgi:type III pantothenate kinase
VAFVERDIAVPIGRQLDPESMVGDDRLLNAAAAYNTAKQACVVVDAGTAVTIDFVDGAGTFHGGAIVPGAKMMLDALHERTEQLPEVAMQRPVEAIGHSTAEAMRCGAFHGIRGMVRELVERYAEAAGGYPLVIATGGDAKLLFEDDELIERIVPDLTLMGMAVTLESHQKSEE